MRWTLATDRLDLEGIWIVLESSPPASGISFASTGYHVHAGELLAGVDAERHRHLLIPLAAGEAARTYTNGRSVVIGRQVHEGVHYLAIVCLRPDLYSVFGRFCRELADSVEAAVSPAREAFDAFQRWRALFSESSMHGVLSEEALIGLIGELRAVQELLEKGASSDLRFWVGPLSQVHDLRSPAMAIEVKTTLVREGRVVGISSVDQLEEPPGVPLYLRHSRLERDPGGFRIDDVLNALLASGADRDSLDRLLGEVGVSIDRLDPYGERRYRSAETRLYDVAGDSFPRIIRSSFAGGDIPPGTLRLKYSIDLTNEPPVPLDEQDAEAVMLAFARDTDHGLDT